MDSILASSRSSLLFFNPIPNPSLSPFSRTRRVRFHRLVPSKSPKSQSKFRLSGRIFSAFSSPQAKTSSSEQAEPDVRLLKCVAKKIALALFFLAVGFSPIRATVRGGAIAAPATATGEVSERKEEEERVSSEGDEYRVFTRRLLETVSLLLRSLEEARKGDDAGAKQVAAAMAAVRTRKEDLDREIGDVHYEELKKLRTEKEPLEKRSEEIVAAAEKKKNSAEEMSRLEKEYDLALERVGEIEDRIMRREILVVSVVRELSFIESECEELVLGFNREMRLKTMDRYERL